VYKADTFINIGHQISEVSGIYERVGTLNRYINITRLLKKVFKRSFMGHYTKLLPLHNTVFVMYVFNNNARNTTRFC